MIRPVVEEYLFVEKRLRLKETEEERRKRLDHESRGGRPTIWGPV
jgi:hypothetical protein